MHCGYDEAVGDGRAPLSHRHRVRACRDCLRWFALDENEQAPGAAPPVVIYSRAEGEGGDPQTRSYARAYRVFNCDQIEGLAEAFYAQADAPRDLGTQGDRALDAWFARLEIPIDTSDEPAAYYTPATDRIHMPPIATFRSTEAYFATLFYEGAHATKHTSRLNRHHTGSAQEQYCREEVVAELAASMVCARLGTENNVEQSAAYLGHWIDILQQDSRAIIRAASMAQAASDWMFEKAGEEPVHNIQPLAA